MKASIIDRSIYPLLSIYDLSTERMTSKKKRKERKIKSLADSWAALPEGCIQ